MQCASVMRAYKSLKAIAKNVNLHFLRGSFSHRGYTFFIRNRRFKKKKRTKSNWKDRAEANFVINGANEKKFGPSFILWDCFMKRNNSFLLILDFFCWTSSWKTYPVMIRSTVTNRLMLTIRSNRPLNELVTQEKITWTEKTFKSFQLENHNLIMNILPKINDQPQNQFRNRRRSFFE